ncbi:Uncharacterized membrane protein YfhO [Eubacterium oxidoreducens]|uniref:Uncharacterized membrane protein YfhO n=1 Tax=Eubacterium oxidoreducens TaxID=1732 RepID=A0A1G6CP16_EUBOX|nr:Uncharacterized membrane protein YfhO [Eubacterium oxidoreducens]
MFGLKRSVQIKEKFQISAKNIGKLRYVIAFGVPVLITLLVMAINNIMPFGSKSMFIWDQFLQHKDYYGYLWDVFHGNTSIDYSTAKSLGGQIFGIIGFYCSSPLNILLIFFKKAQIPQFLVFMTVLRIGLCGVTSHIFLKKRYDLNLWGALILSTSYALMEYCVYYCRNIMWLDGVIFLPLVALGVWALVNKKRWKLLWISVSLSIVCNWYTGYMVCLMAILLFAYELIVRYGVHWIANKGEALKRILQFIMVMLLGVITSAVVLMPSLSGLVSGKATGYRVGISGIIHFDFLHFLSGFEVTAAGNGQDAPIIFCGTLICVAVVCFFICKSILWKEKICAAILLALLIMSFMFQDIELIWTAYVRSTSYYFRFAFVFGFSMIFIAGRVVYCAQNGELKKRTPIIAVVITAVIVGLLAACGELGASKALIFVYVIAFLIGLALLIFRVYWKSRFIKPIIVIFLMAFAFLETGYNEHLSFQEYSIETDTFSEYTNDIEQLLEVLDEDADGAFYRFEKNNSYLVQMDREVATGESLLYGYNSIENYSSAYDIKVDEFLKNVGYSDIPGKDLFVCETYWNSPSLLMDSLLSVRYIQFEDEIYGYTEFGQDEFYGQKVLRNSYALPLGYFVNDAMTESVDFGTNPYENQELFLSAMLGENADVYKSIEPEYEGTVDGMETYTLSVQADGPVYVFLDGTNLHSNYYEQNCAFYVNGEVVQDCCTRFLTNSMYVGDYNAGDEIVISIEHKSDTTGQHTVYAASLDKNVFESAIATLQEGGDTDLNCEGNVISGTIDADESGLVYLSISNEKYWSAYIDGQEVEIENLAGDFMGLVVDEGTHEIYMEYKSPGLRTGLAISIVGVIIFVCVAFFEKKRKRENNASRRFF